MTGASLGAPRGTPWYAAAMLVVDARHWLTEDGSLPFENPRLLRRMLRIARFIEYGGQLAPKTMRETLVECRRRPQGKACPGLMWVVKEPDDTIVAHCILCRTGEAAISNWQETDWANGMMEPVEAESRGGDTRLN